MAKESLNSMLSVIGSIRSCGIANIGKAKVKLIMPAMEEIQYQALGTGISAKLEYAHISTECNTTIRIYIIKAFSEANGRTDDSIV